MALYPSRGYTPDLAQFRIEADDIEDSFTRADGSPGNTDTGEAWTVQTSVPSGADAGTWKIDSNELARDFQKFGSSSVTSTITVPAAADFTLLATLRTSTTDDRLQA